MSYLCNPVLDRSARREELAFAHCRQIPLLRPIHHGIEKLTEITLQSFFLCDTLKPDQGCVPHGIESRIEDPVPVVGIAAAFAVG